MRCAGGVDTYETGCTALYTATYDAAENRRSVLELDGARVTYGYDAADQLTAEQRSGTGAYDLRREICRRGNHGQPPGLA